MSRYELNCLRCQYTHESFVRDIRTPLCINLVVCFPVRAFCLATAWPLCWSGHVRLSTYRFKTRSSLYCITSHSLVNIKRTLDYWKWQTWFQSKTLPLINFSCKSICYAHVILMIRQINLYHTYVLPRNKSNYTRRYLIKPKKIELAIVLLL